MPDIKKKLGAKLRYGAQVVLFDNLWLFIKEKKISTFYCFSYKTDIFKDREKMNDPFLKIFSRRIR